VNERTSVRRPNENEERIDGKGEGKEERDTTRTLDMPPKRRDRLVKFVHRDGEAWRGNEASVKNSDAVGTQM
jgi:hypothetical protein